MATIGGFIDWDRGDESKYGKSFRVRVRVNVTKPLKRGMLVKTEEKGTRRIFFKYERLGNLCFIYGCLNHIMRECEQMDGEVDEELINDLPYGSWLRASPPRRNVVTSLKRWQ